MKRCVWRFVRTSYHNILILPYLDLNLAECLLVCTLWVSMLTFLHLWSCVSSVRVSVCVLGCVCVWRKAWLKAGWSFTMVNWKEPFFYSAINPIWVNNTLLCSRPVTVIRWAPNPRALQTAAGHPNDDKMLRRTLFTKHRMRRIAFHCTVLGRGKR